jgi:GNAT superfamily N-acetyltransferase
VEELTDLLHRAYKRLADMGLRFIATFQDAEATKRQQKRGVCFILTEKEKLVGTVLYYLKTFEDAPDIFKDKDVVLFGKFAVDPEYQNSGLGSYLLNFIEDYARQEGKKQMMLDTSEKAQHLIDYYEKRGYIYIQHWQWKDVNYRSVVMGKKL